MYEVAKLTQNNCSCAAAAIEVSHHPAHLVTEAGRAEQPSAFIPFCTFQGKTPEGAIARETMRLRACKGFQPVLYQGQACFMANPTTLGLTPTAGQGVVHSLMMLLDVNRERSSSLVLDEPNRSENASSKELDLSTIPRLGLAKINIHTLSTFHGFGSAHYKMSVLKQTTGSEAFSALPDSKKKCSLEMRETCQGRHWLKDLRTNCKCQPVSLSVLKIQVIF